MDWSESVTIHALLSLSVPLSDAPCSLSLFSLALSLQVPSCLTFYVSLPFPLPLFALCSNNRLSISRIL